ncbi:hypothetical protein L0F63_005354, partial [Massospora cicadina]
QLFNQLDDATERLHCTEQKLTPTFYLIRPHLEVEEQEGVWEEFNDECVTSIMAVLHLKSLTLPQVQLGLTSLPLLDIPVMGAQTILKYTSKAHGYKWKKEF